MFLDWSVDECLPGELVTLRVSMKAEKIAGFELKLPVNDALEWVAHEPGPLRYQSGVYTQEDRVVAQPTRPGTVSLAGLRAVVREGDTSADMDLTAPVLLVGSYGNGVEDFTPEPLPPVVDHESSKMWWPWIAAAPVVLGALAFLLRRKPGVEVEEAGTLPVLEELGGMLREGELPVARIERFLTERSGEISAGLREALEAAVYGRNRDREKLVRLLEKEAAG